MSSFYTLPDSSPRGAGLSFRSGANYADLVDLDSLGGGTEGFDAKAFGRAGMKGGVMNTELSGPDASYAKAATSTSAAKKSSAAQIGAIGFGMLSDAYSRFHAVEMAQIETRSQADFYGHRSRLLELDYRSAVQSAQAILEQGQREAAFAGLEGAQRRSAMEASAAARGVESNGNVAEALASDRLLEDIDKLQINLAAVRANNAARARAVEISNQQRFDRVTQRNLRRSARYAQPEAALIGGLANAFTAGYGAGGG